MKGFGSLIFRISKEISMFMCLKKNVLNFRILEAIFLHKKTNFWDVDLLADFIAFHINIDRQ